MTVSGEVPKKQTEQELEGREEHGVSEVCDCIGLVKVISSKGKKLRLCCELAHDIWRFQSYRKISK
jgi:hypothetical protein